MGSPPGIGFLCRRLRVPASASEETAAALWRAGGIGSESRPQVDGSEELVAYFALPASPLELPAGVELLAETVIQAQDWMAGWRAQAEPIPIGKRLLVDPREPEGLTAAALSNPDGRIPLRVPARSAFGTGGHESTRLVLELLDEIALDGRRVLDVGTGAGLLSLAALALGARGAIGFDVDLVAPILARQNAQLNGLTPRFFAGSAAALLAGSAAPVGAAGAARARFDVILVNVIPEEIAADLPALAAMLAPSGDAVFSGILRSEGGKALARLRRAGLRRVQSRRAGDWVAYLCRRAR